MLLRSLEAFSQFSSVSKIIQPNLEKSLFFYGSERDKYNKP